MALYELRTYTLRVGAMAEAVKLYQEIGFPAFQKGGHAKKLVGYFQADTGTINQLLHLWKFDDDADRRAHWGAVYANKDFVEGFASKFRPLLITQEVKLLQAAPWGPHPNGQDARLKRSRSSEIWSTRGGNTIDTAVGAF
jgi:NIPSNAP